MKNIICLTALIVGLFTASCAKTYECKNQTGIVAFEVKARSQSKANSLCNAATSSLNPGALTATKK